MNGTGQSRRIDLTVAAVLAAVAGYVDAVFFGRVAEVFAANQSGNAVLLGIGMATAAPVMRGDRRWRSPASASPPPWGR